MFRRFIAFALALLVSVTAMMQPAYAASGELSPKSATSPVVINNRGNNNLIYFHNSFNDPSDESLGGNPDVIDSEFVGGIVNGVVTTAGVAVGVTAACYILDGVASAFFPPAAFLAAGCPGAGAGAGAMAGGAKVLIK